MEKKSKKKKPAIKVKKYQDWDYIHHLTKDIIYIEHSIKK